MESILSGGGWGFAGRSLFIPQLHGLLARVREFWGVVSAGFLLYHRRLRPQSLLIACLPACQGRTVPV